MPARLARLGEPDWPIDVEERCPMCGRFLPRPAVVRLVMAGTVAVQAAGYTCRACGPVLLRPVETENGG